MTVCGVIHVHDYHRLHFAGDKLRDAMLHRISAISRLRLVTSSLRKIA